MLTANTLEAAGSRAWAEADAAERDAEQNPERIAERRRRLVKWVEARAVTT
jgi:hypothetical protein